MNKRRFLIGVVVLAFLVGCGAGPGDAERGRRLFTGEVQFSSASAPVCSTCHGVTPEEGVKLGPNLAGVGTAAATRVSGETAQQYLETTIRNPDAYLVDGFQEGIMYRGYAQALSAQEINDLVAYLLTLK